MGQRLPQLSQSWADAVIRGIDKEFIGAAQASAAGTDALAAGIQQGLAGITAGLLRKRQETRQDARLKIEDEKDAQRLGIALRDEELRRANFQMEYLKGRELELTERARLGEDVTVDAESLQRQQQAVMEKVVRFGPQAGAGAQAGQPAQAPMGYADFKAKFCPT